MSTTPGSAPPFRSYTLNSSYAVSEYIRLQNKRRDNRSSVLIALVQYIAFDGRYLQYSALKCYLVLPYAVKSIFPTPALSSPTPRAPAPVFPYTMPPPSFNSGTFSAFASNGASQLLSPVPGSAPASCLMESWTPSQLLPIWRRENAVSALTPTPAGEREDGRGRLCYCFPQRDVFQVLGSA